MATLPVDFGPQILAVRTPLGERASGVFRLSNMTGSTLSLRARFTTRPSVAGKAFEPIGAFPVTRLRPHESRTVTVPFRVRTDLDARTPEIYVEYVLEPVR
jgi:cytochrome c oxidase assembly protein Cox11